MKINKTTLDFIENVIKSIKLIDCKDIIIEQDMVRGINDGKSAFILSEASIKDDIGVIAFNRTDLFLSRLNLIKDKENFNIDAVCEERDGVSYVKMLNLKAKGIKSDYGCCNPAIIKAPKQVNDKQEYFIKVSEELIKNLMQAKETINTEIVNLNAVDGKLKFKLADMSDVISIDSDDEVLTNDDEPASFNFKYNVKTLLALLKNTEDENSEFSIGTKGLAEISANGLRFYLLPHVGD